MRLPPLLLNLLMLLAIVVNTIPAHAHAPASDASPGTAAQVPVVEAAEPAASGGDDAMPPCHDDGAPAQDELLHHAMADGSGGDPAPPCCDDTAGGCDCACLVQAVALASAVPRLAPAPPRAAPAGAQPASAEPPALASLIRPPIG